MNNSLLTRVYCSFLYIFVLLCLMTACKDNTQSDIKGKELINKNNYVLTSSTRAALEKISHYKILFGHHSVGDNILAGLKSLAWEAGVAINIVSITDPATIKASAFYHFYPGLNRYPETKIDKFVQFFDDTKVDVDVAFMKFCFVDFTPDSNVKHIFSCYKKHLLHLQKKYPEVTFIHCTVPLTARSGSLKDKVKRLMGMQVWGDASNDVRTRFNELLLNEFPHETIFDLARIESTRLDGERVIFMIGEKTVYALAPEYTNDGGHLNELGRKVAASAMVEFLAKVAGRQIRVSTHRVSNYIISLTRNA